MKYITEVGLTNYQGHKDTVVRFGPGFNAIVGESDMGKSALKRGIEAVLYNRYVSEEDIRIGETSFENYVLFSDGTKITRAKGKRLNRYVIDYPNGESLELNNFGVGIPQEVLDAHGMYLVDVGRKGQSLNCADQLDGPFFLKNTPGERAKIISSIANTQVVDEAVYNTLRDYRAEKSQLKELNSDNKKLEKELKEFEYIEEAKLALSNLENDYDLLLNLQSRYLDNKNKFESINNDILMAAKQNAIIELYRDCEIQQAQLDLLISDFTNYRNLDIKFKSYTFDVNRKESLTRDITTLVGIEEVLEKVSALENDMHKYTKLRKELDEYISLKKQQDIMQSKINLMDDVSHVPEEIDLLLNDIRKYNQLRSKQDEINVLLNRKAKGVQVIKEIEDNLNKAVTVYQEELAKHGKCPTCFSEVTPSQFEQIRENLI